MADGQRVRLAIQSPHRLDRDVLAAYLAREPDFRVVGKTATVERLSLLCELRRPDAALVELNSLGTLAELAALCEAFPDMTVVVWHTELDEPSVGEVRAIGVHDVIPGSRGLSALKVALRRPSPATANGALRGRELKVLSLLASGQTVAQIAELLALSPHTVEHDKRRIYARLGVGHQCQAVSVAVSLGLIERDLSGAEPVSLSTREKQILGSIADGHTVRETAQRLGVAVKTVENLQGRLFSKLGTHNRSETLTLAYRMGLVDQ